MLCCEDGFAAVGLDINANHLRAVREGLVTGTAGPIPLGRSTQGWEIRIENEAGIDTTQFAFEERDEHGMPRLPGDVSQPAR
jgi:uncharacterized protein (TIGR00369 family)